jgi:hypothetical protein
MSGQLLDGGYDSAFNEWNEVELALRDRADI